MRFNKILTFLLLAGLASACDIAELGRSDIPYDGEPIEIPVNLSSAPLIKSARISNDAAISSAVIAWYQGGVKKGDKTISGGSGSIKIIPGTYDFYAVTNGSFTFPQNQSDIASTRMSISSFSAIPMGEASISGRSVTSSSSSLNFSVKRLCAKLNFTIEQNYDMGSFTVTSFRIRQAATKVLPFGSDYAATSDSVSDLDYASSSDLSSVNGGGSLILYTPENMMGTCSSITSSANKEPSYLNGHGQSTLASKATYVEVSGRWTAAGVSADVTYRMYIGGNITSDFNIKRNCQYNLTLAFSTHPLDQDVSGYVCPVWKIDVENIEDVRSVSWETETVELRRGENNEISYSVYPSNVDYDVVIYDGDIELQNGSWVTGDTGIQYKLDRNQHKVYLYYPDGASDGIDRIDLYIQTLDDYVNETATLIKIDYSNTHSYSWAFADDYETSIDYIDDLQWNDDFTSIVLLSDDEPSSINLITRPSHRNNSILMNIPLKYIDFFDDGSQVYSVYQIDIDALKERSVSEFGHYNNHVWLWNFTENNKSVVFGGYDGIPALEAELGPYTGHSVPLISRGPWASSQIIVDSENIFYDSSSSSYRYPLEAGCECYLQIQTLVSVVQPYFDLYLEHLFWNGHNYDTIESFHSTTNVDSSGICEFWFKDFSEPWPNDPNHVCCYELD